MKIFEKLIYKKTNIPILDDYNSPDTYWYPHPPCLVPLFLGYGASYKGIIHHFFCDRKNTFVEYFLENGYFLEIARNENQLYTIMILNMIVIKDDISDEIIDFCKEIGYMQLDEVDKFSIKHGDNLSQYHELVYYSQNTPFKYIENINEYDGDFPSSLTILNLKELDNACSSRLPIRNYYVILKLQFG